MKSPCVLLFAFGLALAGCDLGSADDDGGGATDGASNSGGDAPGASAVAGCREACDRLQFFDCIDGDTHEVCWNACPNRVEGEVELFASCVMNSVPSCDPACLDNLLDADEPGSDSTSGGSSDSGTTPSSCEAACQAYVDAGCDVSDLSESPSCALACGALSTDEQAVVAACLNAPDTCEINPVCLEGAGEGGAGDETGGDVAMACQGACDGLLFFDCIDPAEHGTCFELCESEPEPDAETFTACVNTVGASCDGSCYDVFAG